MTWQRVTGFHQPCTSPTLPKIDQKEPVRILSRGQQSMWGCIWHTPKISLKFAWEWKSCPYSTTSATKTALISFSFSLIISRHHFKMQMAYTFPARLRRKMSRVLVDSLQSFLFCIFPFFSVFSFFVRSVCQSFGALLKRHVTWHTRVSQPIWRSKFPEFTRKSFPVSVEAPIKHQHKIAYWFSVLRKISFV